MKHTLSNDALRKLPHADWLAEFAASLQMTREKRGAPMTPFILGAISRLQMAADYIRVIEKELSASVGFDPATGETSPPFERESDEDIYRRGSLATMFIGDPPMDVLPGGKGWVPYDREVAEAAKARGEKVTLNVRMPNR